jgi:hypothetical protein
VTLYPSPDARDEELDALLARIQSLAGALPGLTRVEIHPPSGETTDSSRSYTMTFDSDAHMQAYTAHSLYQAIRPELHRLCPRATASVISMRAPTFYTQE